MSEMPEVTDLCWPVDTSCDSGWGDLPAATQELASALATASLRRLTAYRVGGCPITVRPCRENCAQGFLPYSGVGTSFSPGIDQYGRWVNNGCRCTTSDCSCGNSCSVRLPLPIGRIDTVKVNGAATSSYRITPTGIAWTGTGDCPWPSCQDLSLPDTEPGTMSVTYLNAYPVDGVGAWAAGLLASEFAKGCSGGKCRLPPGVVGITRQGVSIDIVAGSFPGGFTGIREVDAFIGIWNPRGAVQQGQVWSPDLEGVQ
jgi:hypothetical protein